MGPARAMVRTEQEARSQCPQGYSALAVAYPYPGFFYARAEHVGVARSGSGVQQIFPAHETLTLMGGAVTLLGRRISMAAPLALRLARPAQSDCRSQDVACANAGGELLDGRNLFSLRLRHA